MTEPINILDSTGKVVATASVEDTGSHYSGTVDIRYMPVALRELFGEFEDLVNDQVLSRLDEIEQRIQHTAFIAEFSDGSRANARDIQIFPKGGTISFRASREVSVARKVSPRTLKV